MILSLIRRLRIYISKYYPRLDPEYSRIFAFVARTNNYSIAHVQRHFILGYSRTCRLMDVIQIDIEKLPRGVKIKEEEGSQ